MTLLSLPKTVALKPDELLSSWLTRVAATNYCEPSELLLHLGIEGRHVAALDFALDAPTAEKIAFAARAKAETVQSSTFQEMTQNEAFLTAQFAFQSCPVCSERGVELKHWRRVWSFDCLVCGARLLPTLAQPEGTSVPEKLLRRARRGAWLLEQAVQSKSTAYIRRSMRVVTFARALLDDREDAAFALQSFKLEIRLRCLAAIAVVQKRPLVKAAKIVAQADALARVALLRTYQNEPRLLAVVDRLVARGVGNSDTQISQLKAKNCVQRAVSRL